MKDYYETYAYTVNPVQLCISEEKAREIAQNLIDSNKDLQEDQIDSGPDEALMLVKTDTGYNVSSSVSGFTNLNAYEDFLIPFLKQCVDPNEQLLLMDTCCGGGCDNSQNLILRPGIASEDIYCGSDDALLFVSKMIQAGTMTLDESGLSLTK